MRITKIEPVADRGDGTRTLALFDLELTDEVKLYGFRLVEHQGRRLTYAPNATGGRRTATFAPALADRITRLAVKKFEGQATANDARNQAA